MSDLSPLEPDLHARSQSRCELCEGTDALAAREVGPSPEPSSDRAVLLCAPCRDRIAADTLDPADWFGLQGAAWSEVAAVQVLSWRLLHRLDAGWAVDLRDQIYLDEATADWARAGLATSSGPATVDSNGTPLADGDSVTLIKDLDVKGANFTAKRGTLVKGIRLGDDPGLVLGRVNKTSIYLKTEFLKKA